MSNITKLVNPKSKNYYKLKEFVMSNKLGWVYNEYSVSDGGDFKGQKFYSHTVIERPFSWTRIEGDEFNFTDEETSQYDLVPNILSPIYRTHILPFLYELMGSNSSTGKCEIRSILRINFNSVHSDFGKGKSHTDHPFPHKNMLVYFTNTGGDTIVGDEHYTPEEDDIIVFDSQLHNSEPPKSGRRVVMVMTFI